MDAGEVRKGSEIWYDDGRVGHSGVRAVVLEVRADYMVVQFDDRVDTTTIRFSDREWMDFLRLA